MQDFTKENIEILDGIDFEPYFKYAEKGHMLREFLNAIEVDFDGTELTNNDILEGCIFNWLSEFETIEYFEKRYPDKFKVTEISYYIFC